ncbi:hypothetical protein SEVIR_1G062190v4 [Setaria viridis]
MAPRRAVLLLLVAAAAASSLLASSSAVLVHAARDPGVSCDQLPVAEATTGFQPLTVDADGGLSVPPHLIHPAILADATDNPAVQRTVRRHGGLPRHRPPRPAPPPVLRRPGRRQRPDLRRR